MCGIFSLLNYNDFNIGIISEQFMKGVRRGPEFSKLDSSFNNIILGFHRLAINGLDNESNQPLIIGDVALICNGEIYNYKRLYSYMGIKPITGSDCEVIIHLYIKYGIEQTLKMLDGVYAFILYDNRVNSEQNKKCYVARDPLGIRPLYYLKNKVSKTIVSDKPKFGFASELKCLEYFYNNNIDELQIEQFSPGTFTELSMDTNTNCNWIIVKENVSYFDLGFSHSWLINSETKYMFIDNLWSKMASYLDFAVNKRCLTTERPIACLLSGGLDSSLIAALVNNHFNLYNQSNKLETYSIGLVGSEDLKYARIVADYLGTKHTEIVVTEEEMFEAIPEVIRAIESYDTTTVRASIGNYLLGKYISKNSESKVIFNGDGSDELLGGYLYMNNCPDDIEFDKESRRLLKDIHLFDVLRSDKSISSHGLEPRTPFLDRSFVNFVLSIPPYIRNPKNNAHTILGIEKDSLRRSFLKENFTDYKDRQILPDEILWRRKEAFSDGVSSHGRSLYKILQEKIAVKLTNDTGTNFEANIDTEKYYYKQLFNSYFPNCIHILPYYWMPKYIDAKDPSARTLEIYSIV